MLGEEDINTGRRNKIINGDTYTDKVMTKAIYYEVKDINKNGKIDDWEQAKYDAINKSSAANMSYDSPAKQMQPIVDPMTGMPVVPAQSANNVFPPQTQQVAGQMFGQQMPGMYGSALAKKGCKYKK
jgi:hypothetical protein